MVNCPCSEQGRNLNSQLSSPIFAPILPTQDLFWYQHVSFLTHYREATRPSLLDLILTDDESMVDEVMEGEPLGKSDHVTITWKYLYDVPQPKKYVDSVPALKYNYKKGNYADMKVNLRTIDWSSLEHMEIEDCWGFIMKVVEENVMQFVPKFKKKSSKPAAPWWSKELTREVKQIQAMERILE